MFRFKIFLNKRIFILILNVLKTPSSQLFDLINTLSVTEKRYVVLYLSKHSDKGNRYTALFDFISRQSEFNEEAAILHLKMLKNKNEFAVLKTQLYDQVLQALSNYDLFSNVEQQLIRGFHQCQLLVQKGLFGQAEKKLSTISAKAKEMDMSELQLQIHHLKLKLKARNYYSQTTADDLTAWEQEANKILDTMATSVKYRYLRNEAYRIQYTSGVRGKELADKMKKIVDQKEFRKREYANTHTALLDFFQVNALYHFTNSDTQKAYKFNLAFLEELESKPLLMQLHADKYFSVLNNFLIDCLLLKKFDTLEEGLEKLKGLKKITNFKKLTNFEANSFRLSSLLQLNYWMEKGDFTKIHNNIPDILTGLEIHKATIVKHTRFTLLYLMAYSCFIMEKYDGAIDLLNPILQEKENKVVEDIQFGARILQLLCFYEKNEKLLVSSLIKSIRKSLLQKNEAFDIHRKVVSGIQKSLKQEIEFSVLLTEIEKLAGINNTSMNLFHFIAWAKAKKENRKMSETWMERDN